MALKRSRLPTIRETAEETRSLDPARTPTTSTESIDSEDDEPTSFDRRFYHYKSGHIWLPGGQPVNRPADRPGVRSDPV